MVLCNLAQTQTLYVPETGLELLVFLPLPSKSWDCMCAPPCLVSACISVWPVLWAQGWCSAAVAHRLSKSQIWGLGVRMPTCQANVRDSSLSHRYFLLQFSSPISMVLLKQDKQLYQPSELVPEGLQDPHTARLGTDAQVLARTWPPAFKVVEV